MSLSIRSVGPEDWESIRDIRLRMLQDTPIAYSETLEQAATLSELDWRRRGQWGEARQGASIAAIIDDQLWVGMMGGFVDAERGAMLVGVYVEPSKRGRIQGVTDALLDEMLQWSSIHGGTLTLDVHESNSRAIAFYERRGFKPTGARRLYNLPPFGDEIEMIYSA